MMTTRTIRKYHAAMLSLAGSLWMAGCTASSDYPESPDGTSGRTVNLSLQVEVADPPVPYGTRAEETPDDSYFFEDGMAPYERLNTLRVILCDKDGKVKYNRLVRYNAAGGLIMDDLVFKVDPGVYDIHLVANESSLPADVRTGWDGKKGLSNIMPDEIYGISCIPEAVLNSAATGVSNTGVLFNTNDYIPMTEDFRITVNPVKTEKDRNQEFHAFVTRVPVKFTFALRQKAQYLTVNLDKIADRQYLMPHDVEYSEQTVNGKTGRIITEYSTPATAEGRTFTHTFTLPAEPVEFSYAGIGADGATAKYYVAPPVYLCETTLPADGLKMKINVVSENDNDGEMTVPVKLPNLPSLPRNTHVVVLMDNTSKDIKCTVVVVPYIGVYLNPTFGFNELLPGWDSTTETPPWVTIDGEETQD